MKKCYLSIIILLSLNANAEHVFKAYPKGYQGSLVVDPYFTESDFIFKEYNPLPWTELERSVSNTSPLISNQTIDFIQNGTATILQERTIQHIYTNTKINTDVVRQTSVEQQTITEPVSQNVIVTKTNSIETEHKSNCTEWTPETDTKFTDEMIEQTQECDVQIVDTYSYSINGNVVDQKDLLGTITKTFEQEVEGTKSLGFSSCKEILDAGMSTGDGSYILNEHKNPYSANCDMVNGGLTQIDNSLFDGNQIKNNQQIVKLTSFKGINGAPRNTQVVGVYKPNNYNNDLYSKPNLYTLTAPYSFPPGTNHVDNAAAVFVGGFRWFSNNGLNIKDYTNGIVIFNNSDVGLIKYPAEGWVFEDGTQEDSYFYYQEFNYTLWRK